MKAKIGQIILTIVRSLYGVFFIIDGALRLKSSIQGTPEPHFAQAAAQAFNGPVFATAFMNPLLGSSFIVAGFCLFFKRTSPLGVALLLPSMVVIFFFHVFLTKSFLWAGGHMLFVLFLLWVYRHAFTPLWNYGVLPPNNSFETDGFAAAQLKR